VIQRTTLKVTPMRFADTARPVNTSGRNSIHACPWPRLAWLKSRLADVRAKLPAARAAVAAAQRDDDAQYPFERYSPLTNRQEQTAEALRHAWGQLEHLEAERERLQGELGAAVNLVESLLGDTGTVRQIRQDVREVAEVVARRRRGVA
jgi:multidrug resistance efflux pump